MPCLIRKEKVFHLILFYAVHMGLWTPIACALLCFSALNHYQPVFPLIAAGGVPACRDDGAFRVHSGGQLLRMFPFVLPGHRKTSGHPYGESEKVNCFLALLAQNPVNWSQGLYLSDKKQLAL